MNGICSKGEENSGYYISAEFISVDYRLSPRCSGKARGSQLGGARVVMFTRSVGLDLLDASVALCSINQALKVSRAANRCSSTACMIIHLCKTCIDPVLGQSLSRHRCCDT